MLVPRAELVPLPVDAYPVFNKYPEFIVNHQAAERDRIMREEQDMLEKRYVPCSRDPRLRS